MRTPLCLLALGILLRGFAQEEMIEDSTTSCEEEPVPCCPRGPHPSRLSVRHLEYQGIGFNQGYSTFELYLANSNAWCDSNYLFLDLRGHIFNDGKPACNAGFGWRYLFDSSLDAVGLNAYYDFRKAEKKKYNQFGLGLEYLTPCLEFRANGYLPFGSKVSPLFDLKFSHFFQNNFFVSRKHEYAMGGADAEVGWHFKQWKNIDLFVGAGPYYFKGHYAEAAIGGKARIKARLTRFVSLEVGDSYDAVFHNRFQAELTLSIPFGPRSKPNPDKCCSCKRQNWMQQWVHDPPTRNEILVVDAKKKTSLGLDPVTGLPIFLIFVNNTSSSNGTFESPFPTLALASAASKPGDTIYVFPGDGTTNGMNMGIVLQDNQRFLGSGVSHGFNTTLGHAVIPPQTTALPVITNAGPVVTVVLNNEVAGFQILGGTTGVINNVGAWTNAVVSTNINRNQILFTAGHGIDLTTTSSQAQIVIDQNSIIEPTGRGITMNHTVGSQVFNHVSSNAIENTGLDNIFVTSIDLGTRVDTLIEGNTIVSVLAPGVGSFMVRLETQGDSAHFSSLRNNQILSGISVTAFPLQGLFVDHAVGTTSLSQTVTHIEHNTFVGTLAPIIVGTSAGGAGSLEARINNNQIRHAFGSSGIGIISAGAFLKATVIDNEIIGTIPGITDFITGGAQHELICTGNTFSNCGGGINIFCLTGTANTLIENNLFTNTLNPQGIGLQITSDGGAGATFVRAKVLNNRFSGFDDSVTSAAGFTALARAGGTLCLRLVDNESDTNFSIDNQSLITGTVLLEPPTGNIGAISLGPPITHVPPGTCD